MRNKLEWIKKLIAEDRLEEFYTSKSWRKCRAESFKRYHYECQECKRQGRLTVLGHPNRPLQYGEQVGIGHHVKSVKEHPELALNSFNIEPVCWSCHNIIEKRKENNREVTPEFFG